MSFLKLYRFFWIALYLALYYLLHDLIDERFLRDSGTIANIMSNGSFNDGDGGYSATAYIFNLIPNFLLSPVVTLIGSVAIYLIAHEIKTFQGVLLAPLIIGPFIILNLMAPTKETIVITMSIIILIAARRISHTLIALFLILALYGLYSYFIRGYYFIIMAFLILLMVIKDSPLKMRFVYIISVFLVLLILPAHIYSNLQGPKDMVVEVIMYYSDVDVRTVFANPFPPDNFWHFIGNYIYSFIVLNIPMIRLISIKELILFFNVVVWVTLIRTGYKHLKGPERILSLLFFAHMLTLPLLEPDLGSYFRHESSVFLYLTPALRVYERRQNARILL